MKLTSLFAIGLIFTLAASAASPDQKKNELHEMLERAQKAKAEGRYEEARQIAEQLRKEHGFEKGEHRGPHDQPDAQKREKLGHMKAEFEELRRAGKHEEAEHLRQKFAGELMAGHKSGHPESGPSNERLKHLMEAIKHLRAANLNEPAESLEHVAAKMREEMQARKRAEEAAHASKHPEGKGGEGEIHEMREQIQKLAHAVEELRGQLKKAQGDTEVRKPEKP